MKQNEIQEIPHCRNSARIQYVNGRKKQIEMDTKKLNVSASNILKI